MKLKSNNIRFQVYRSGDCFEGDSMACANYLGITLDAFHSYAQGKVEHNGFYIVKVTTVYDVYYKDQLIGSGLRTAKEMAELVYVSESTIRRIMKIKDMQYDCIKIKSREKFELC